MKDAGRKKKPARTAPKSVCVECLLKEMYTYVKMFHYYYTNVAVCVYVCMWCCIHIMYVDFLYKRYIHSMPHMCVREHSFLIFFSPLMFARASSIGKGLERKRFALCVPPPSPSSRREVYLHTLLRTLVRRDVDGKSWASPLSGAHNTRVCVHSISGLCVCTFVQSIHLLPLERVHTAYIGIVAIF